MASPPAVSVRATERGTLSSGRPQCVGLSPPRPLTPALSPPPPLQAIYVIAIDLTLPPPLLAVARTAVAGRLLGKLSAQPGHEVAVVLYGTDGERGTEGEGGGGKGGGATKRGRCFVFRSYPPPPFQSPTTPPPPSSPACTPASRSPLAA